MPRQNSAATAPRSGGAVQVGVSPWPPPPRRPPGASAMSSARVVLGARCSPDARACRVSRTRARPVLARRASGSSHPPSSISSAPARRVVVVCKEVAAQTAAGLFSVSNLLQGRVDVWCRCVVAGLYLSDDVRADTAVSLVLVPPEETGAGLDRPSGGCRVVTVAGDAVEGLAPAEARVAILLRARSNTPLSSDFQSSDAPGRGRERGRAGTGTRTGTGTGTGTRTGTGNGDSVGTTERNAARRREGWLAKQPGSRGPVPGFEVRDHPSLSAALRAILPRRTYLLDIDGAPMRTALAAEVGDDDDGVGIVAGDNAGLGRGARRADGVGRDTRGVGSQDAPRESLRGARARGRGRARGGERARVVDERRRRRFTCHTGTNAAADWRETRRRTSIISTSAENAAESRLASPRRPAQTASRAFGRRASGFRARLTRASSVRPWSLRGCRAMSPERSPHFGSGGDAELAGASTPGPPTTMPPRGRRPPPRAPPPSHPRERSAARLSGRGRRSPRPSSPSPRLASRSAVSPTCRRRC